MKRLHIIGIGLLAITSVAAVTTIRWTDIRDRHGNGSKGQASDGTGTSGNIPQYDSSGNVVDSGVSAAAIAANYSQSFSSQTSVELTHNLNTSSVIVQCYDASSPPNKISPLNTALTDANNVTVTFSASQSGSCTVNGMGGSGALSVSSYLGAVPALTSPGAVGAWTWVNQGGATATASNGGIYMEGSSGTGGLAGHSARMLVVSAPTPPYEFVAAVGMINPSTTYWDGITGIVARDSSSGKLFTCELEDDNCSNSGCTTGTANGNPMFSSANYWSDANTLTSDQVLDYYRFTGWFSPPLIKYGDDGTNRYCSISMDGGNHWLKYVDQPRSTNLTANQIGWFASATGSTTSSWAAMLMSWLRTI